ncbi:DsbC family protein [Carnimonas bestiolae]|uniref:DsbC family protein n=1 Tax=Carnimonas bestiolae TaxID=3402172 RepID=UPI003F4AAC1D
MKTSVAVAVIGVLAGCSDGDNHEHQQADYHVKKQDSQATSGDPQTALKGLKINGQDVQVTSVRPTKLSGPLYEVRLASGEIIYSDTHGRQMVLGTYYDNAPEGLKNLTEESGRQARLEQLSKVSDRDRIVYPAQGQQKATITVFTDPTCPYCQALHGEINKLTSGGITVNYIPFPRSGPDSPAGRQLAQILCSDDPAEAITTAFNNGALKDGPSESCAAAVRKGHELGSQFGVQGTPSIVLPSGEMGQGYMPADQLVQAALQDSNE